MTQTPDLPTAGRFDGDEHVLPVRVYYEDTDFSGRVYHANYLRFFERARTDFLRLAGVGHSALLELEEPLAIAIVHMSIDFKRGATIDDALVVRTRFEKNTGVRFTLSQRIERAGELLCAATVQGACIDLDGRPRRMPKAVSDCISPWLKPLAP